MSYEKQVRYFFDAEDMTWRVTAFTETTISFAAHLERFNLVGEAEVTDGKWHLKERSRRALAHVAGTDVVRGLERFFNEHGVPAP